MKGVQCYELFGGIALKNQAFSIFIAYVYTMLFVSTRCLCITDSVFTSIIVLLHVHCCLINYFS